ncbi:GNAT family N-acetyltransferase [Sulfurimonas sp. HSL3-2]|uniref:GNAT family N-acetyltransferase n=1 Tax=Hydrocurvibacter mobilis TaxID=3131936 RepID=UPI0031F90E2A
MQIREITLTELHVAYEILQHEKGDISYKEFEDLIYEMRKENYKILTIIEKDVPISYIGVKIETSLFYKKHLHVYEFITIKTKNTLKYNNEMLSYLIDYAKMNMCKNIIFSIENDDLELTRLIIRDDYQKKGSLYIKEIV